MDQDTELITSVDLDISDCWIGKCPKRAGLVETPVELIGVEMGFVFGEDRPQMRTVDDRDPVEDLAAYGSQLIFGTYKPVATSMSTGGSTYSKNTTESTNPLPAPPPKYILAA